MRTVLGMALAFLATAPAVVKAEGEVPRCGLYEYRAVIKRVIDGDTVEADIDLGFRMWLHGERLRLIGIDAPELKGATLADGQRSSAALAKLIEGKQVNICTVRDKSGADDQDKYGRYLAHIWVNGQNINQWMVEKAFAVRKQY